MKRTDRITKIVSLLMFGTLLAYLGVYIFRSVTNDVRTAPAVFVSITESSEASGIIVREETLVSSNDKYLSVSAKNGSLLAAGDVIAVAYSNDAALERASKIRELELKQQYISSVLSEKKSPDNLTERDTAIKNAVTELAAAAARGETDRLSSAAMSLGSLVVENPEITASEEDLNVVNRQLQELRQTSSSDTAAITAESSGLFSTAPDGYEFITPTALKGLDSNALRSLTAAPKELAPDVRGKLVSPYEWYFASIISKKDADKLTPGKNAKLDFGRYYSQPLTALVVSVSPENKGECVVTFRCTQAASEMLPVRLVAAEIIFETHEGIRVPKEAVYSDEGGSYVYTLTGLQAEKKYISIVWETESFYLAESVKDAAALRVGNEIILTSKEIYDGKVMR